MSVWVEVRLREGAIPSLVYDGLERVVPDHGLLFHHFWDEPWWEGRYVVRLECGQWSRRTVENWLSSIDGINHVAVWDATPDEQHYGDDWPLVAEFFKVSSLLAATGKPSNGQLVHCFLNAQGISPLREALFASRFARGRLSIMWRWPFYLKRRWVAENQELLEGVRANVES